MKARELVIWPALSDSRVSQCPKRACFYPSIIPDSFALFTGAFNSFFGSSVLEYGKFFSSLTARKLACVKMCKALKFGSAFGGCSFPFFGKKQVPISALQAH